MPCNGVSAPLVYRTVRRMRTAPYRMRRNTHRTTDRIAYRTARCNVFEYRTTKFRKLLTLRESPPARPKTATLAKSIDYRDLSVSFPATMPRGVVSIRGVWEHAEKQRKGDAVIPQEGRMEEDSEEEAGEGRGEEADEEEGRTSRKARGLLDTSRSLLGCLLGASWRPLGASWGPLGGPGRFLDRLRRFGGASWGLLGASCEHLGGLLGPSWRPLGSLLGPSWGHLGASWGHLKPQPAEEAQMRLGTPPPSPPPQK